MIKFMSKIALEDIDNYTICVLEKDGIRKMKQYRDVDAKLVYISKVAMLDREFYKIEKDEVVRCAEVSVTPKIGFY